MRLQWFNAREAANTGSVLASQLASEILAVRTQRNGVRASKVENALTDLLLRANREVQSLRLNFYKRAKLAHAFKWRLLENGIEVTVADEMTRLLLLHLSRSDNVTIPLQSNAAIAQNPGLVGNAEQLFAQGNKYFAQGAYDRAVANYQDSIAIRPDHADGITNLGAAFCKIGRYKEAGGCFHRSMEIQPNNPDTLNNLGMLFVWVGRLRDAEKLLRQAIKLNPKHLDAHNNLGFALILLGRARDARSRFQKVLKAAPRNAEAVFGMGQVARIEGRFDDAKTMFSRALEIRPRMAGPLAAFAGLQNMHSSDGTWLERAELMLANGIAPLQEAEMRFAIGKYWDDVGDFARAFENYKRANELQKTVADVYDRKARTRFVDDFKRVHTKETVCASHAGSSNSSKPVFVVGMMRSGTSLVEQIIASHPVAAGAGELGFWSGAISARDAVLRERPLDDATRTELAGSYLRVLSDQFADAQRVVDKAPINSDYLGIIHSVFPNARIVYVRRNPIDTCLSCYFQQLLPCHEFTMDLSDLEHYYREHHRLVSHWLAVLPKGTVLEVTYEELVADLKTGTRRILDFLGLQWDARCLQFHDTKRQVATASYWQVRQRIFQSSVDRWRNYEKFLGPLRGLKTLNQ